MSTESQRAAFTSFVTRHEPHLRRALVAWYGDDIGREGVAEALAWGWGNWGRLSKMDNPAGYLFRVGQTHARRMLRRRLRRVPSGEGHAAHTSDAPWVEPALVTGMKALTPRQRTAVVLVHAYGMSHAEVAELIGIRRSTVQNHVERGMGKLRLTLGVSEGE